MPKAPITRVSSLSITPTSNPATNQANNGFYVPQLTQTQINTISTPQNGAIVYNTDNKSFSVYQGTTWVNDFGSGDIVGPDVSVIDNITTFADKTGNLIKDSGVNVTRVPPSPSLKFFRIENEINDDDVTQIGGLGNIQFINNVGMIFVEGIDEFMPVEFITNTSGDNSQACSIFTGINPTTSSSYSALVELQSTTGALLLSRLAASDIDALVNPIDGMMLYNTDVNSFNIRQAGSWVTIENGNVTGPGSSITGDIAIFSDTTGEVISDSGINISNVYSAGNPTTIIDTTGMTGNFAIGTGVLQNNTFGGLNIAIGADALSQNVDGNYNLAIGHNALSQNIDGSQNVAIGLNTLSNNTTGFGNLAIGFEALSQNVDGNYNIAFGGNALSQNTTGLSNLAIGFEALSQNISGIQNLAFGYATLQSNTTGGQNTAIGINALQSNTTGSNNLAIGDVALQNNLTGGFNLAVGNNALQNNLGDENLAIGFGALQNNTTGSENLAIGFSSLQNNLTGFGNLAIGQNTLVDNLGDQNIAIGFEALAQNTTGNYNLAIGYQALLNNSTGESNVAIGTSTAISQVAYNNCTFLGTGADASMSGLTNAIAIGANAIVGQSNAMVLGDGTINVGIGTSTPNTSAILDLTSTTKALLFPRTPTAFIATPIDGMMVYDTTLNSFNIRQAGSWVTIGNVTGPGSSITGDIAIFSDTTGEVISDSGINISNVYSASNPTTIIDTSSTTTNFAIGTEALANNTSGEGNLAVGFQALLNNASGLSNLAIGCTTLLNNTTGNYNLAIGFGALQNNTIGLHNLAIGYQALENNTTGNYNLAIGEDTLGKTTGNNNLAFGFQAAFNNTTGNYNVVFGYQAAFNNTTGNSNLAVGQSALKNNITGANNVALGFQAGTTQASYSLCTFLGSGADASVSGLTNAIAIGANAIVGQSNAMVLGNGVNVGIGSNSPTYSLHLGTDNSSTPLICLESTSIPSTPSGTRGIYSNISGQPYFRSATDTYSGALVAASTSISGAPTSGTSTLNGTTGITISTTAILTTSLVLVTHTAGTGAPTVTNFGTLGIGSIANGTSFKIYSSNALDTGSVFWQIINPA